MPWVYIECILIFIIDISLRFPYKGYQFLINLVNSAGNMDNYSELATAFRIANGVLVIPDCPRGIGLQTKTALIQALAKHVKPALVLCVDRILIELQGDKESNFRLFAKSIANVNAVISTHPDGALEVYTGK